MDRRPRSSRSADARRPGGKAGGQQTLRPDRPETRISDGLDDGADAALQIGPTDKGMVRLIITTQKGVFDLDFPPDEAREIAEELLASAERAQRR